MKANPEIIMSDKLNGKDLKLGEYELDDETGALYVGTHGMIFPSGSGNTPYPGGSDDGFVNGFRGMYVEYSFKKAANIKTDIDLHYSINATSNYGFFPIPNYTLAIAEVNFNPNIVVNYSVFTG